MALELCLAQRVALLAGLGGRTIAEILARRPDTTRALTACILCPSHLEADIRPALERAFASGKPAVVNVKTDPLAKAISVRQAAYRMA